MPDPIFVSPAALAEETTVVALPAMPREAAPKAAELEPELLDQPGLSYPETARALSDLARVNRWLLGYLPLLRVLVNRIAALGGPVRLLDLGTGSGDVAGRLHRALGRRGVEATVVGVDRKLSHLLIGRTARAGQGEPRLLVAADARALPFRDRAFDWTFSTLFFHHFVPAVNRRIVGEMRRTASQGAAVVDLRAGRQLRWLTRLLLPLLGTGRVAYHDGLVSARQSYSLSQVAAVADPATITELKARFPCRFGLLLSAGE